MSDEEFYSSSDSDSDSDNESVVVPRKALGRISSAVENEDSEPDDADISDEELDENEVVEVFDVEDNPDIILESEDEEDEEDEQEDDELEEQVVKPKKSVEKKSNKKQLMILDDDIEDEDEEFSENYMEKFDSDLVKNYVVEFHPECVSHNYDEITKLSNIVKNSDGIIIDPLHRTIPYLTKYEKARILGQRAKQIETGSKPFVKVPENIIDGYIIAELELKEKKIPFIIKRPIPGGACEYWNLKDLEIVAF